MGRLCLNCKSPQHLSHQCPHPNTGNDIRLCYGCGQKGHILKNCPAKGNKSAMHQPKTEIGNQMGLRMSGNTLNRKSLRGKTKHKEAKCFRCGMTGHKQNDCKWTGQHMSGNGRANGKVVDATQIMSSSTFYYKRAEQGDKRLYGDTRIQYPDFVHPKDGQRDRAPSGFLSSVTSDQNENDMTGSFDSSANYAYGVYNGNSVWNNTKVVDNSGYHHQVQGRSNIDSWNRRPKGNVSISSCVSSESGENQVKCYNCDEFGHLSRDCTKPRACFLCGESTHVARQCKYAQIARLPDMSLKHNEEKDTACEGNGMINTIGDNKLRGNQVSSNAKASCLNCNQSGHRLKNCPYVRRCFLCSNVGHVARECPKVLAMKSSDLATRHVAYPDPNSSDSNPFPGERSERSNSGQYLILSQYDKNGMVSDFSSPYELGSSVESLYSLSQSSHSGRNSSTNSRALPQYVQSNEHLASSYHESSASVRSGSTSSVSSQLNILHRGGHGNQEAFLFQLESPVSEALEYSPDEGDEVTSCYDTNHMCNVVSQLVANLDLQ